jgi:hypothetical protein
VAVAVASWAACVVLWSFAALRLPVAPRQGWDAEVARRAPPLARYDSGWYLHIAEHGYGTPPGPGEKSEHVFFPLYPLLVGGLAKVSGVDAFLVALAVSASLTIAAGALFVEEGRRRLGDTGARHALAFLLLFPTSFFLLAMYAESLFLLLSLLAFAAVQRRRFGMAAAFGLLAGLTRAPAAALALPLALAVLEIERARNGGGDASRPLAPGAKWRALAVGAAPAVGVALWMVGIGLYYGEPGLYFRLQRAWGRGASPAAGALQWLEALPSRLAAGDARTHPAFLVDYACALLFALIAIQQARRRRWADASWTAGALLMPVATGISASVPRYLVVVYPAFYALAETFRDRPLARRVWWVASGALLAAATAAFVLWRWVA